MSDINATDDGLSYVRTYYRVPAHVGSRVAFTWGQRVDGTIVGSYGAHLAVLLDGATMPTAYHPTWRIEYLPATTASHHRDKTEAALLAEMVARGADHFHVGSDGSATFSRQWTRPLDLA